MSEIQVAVSYGELLDKIAILEIKYQHITEPAKRANIEDELELLRTTWSRHPASRTALDEERRALKAVNEALWDIEDRIRLKERDAAFDAEFIELARSVYIRNDERAAIKRTINLQLGSRLVEEKSYQEYRSID